MRERESALYVHAFRFGVEVVVLSIPCLLEVSQTGLVVPAPEVLAVELLWYGVIQNL